MHKVAWGSAINSALTSTAIAKTTARHKTAITYTHAEQEAENHWDCVNTR